MKKHKHLQDTLQPIMTKLMPQGEGMPDMGGGMPDMGGGMPDMGGGMPPVDEVPAGPTIDEVD